MYSRRRPLEELPQENTKIWVCETATCKGWIRDNFAFDSVPTCHLCHSPMVSCMRMLPQVDNSNKNMKSLKKGTSIT